MSEEKDIRTEEKPIYIHSRNNSTLLVAVLAVMVFAAACYFFINPGGGSEKIEVVKDTIEAGKTVDVTALVKVKDEFRNSYTIGVPGEVEQRFDQTGKTKITYDLISTKTGRNEEEVDISFEVVDTTPPVIKQTTKKLYKGSKVDYEKLIKVTDRVDGKITDVNYTIKGNINTKKTGKYKVAVSASDRAGNTAKKTLKFKVVSKSSSKKAFMKKITGLWLNGSQDSKFARQSARGVGLTDCSMTEFVKSGKNYYMTTLGDIKGEYGGDTVPSIRYQKIKLTKVSKDLRRAKGTVGGKKIEFDLGDPNDKVIFYRCAGYYTHCAYTGFKSKYEMDAYHGH